MWFLGREDLFVFDEIKDPSRLVIDSSPTTLPPKRFFIPRVETLLRYKRGSM